MDKKKKKKKKSSVDIESIRKRIVPVKRTKKPLKVGVYGKPGVGKTTFIAMAPKVLLIDCNEEGTLSIEDLGIDVIYIKKFEDINLIYWFLAKGTHKYKTVGIDSITSLQAMGLKFVLDEAASLDLTKDPAMPDRRDYGKLNILMSDVIENFRNLPMHVIFSAHERTREEEDGDIEVFPLMTPGVRSHFEGLMDIIGRLYTREVENESGKRKIVRRMLVGPHDRYITKTRSKKLGSIIKDPTFPLMLKKTGR